MEALIEKEIKIDADDASPYVYYFHKEKNLVKHNLEVLNDLKNMHGLNVETYTYHTIVYSLVDFFNYNLKNKKMIKIKFYENESNLNVKMKNWRLYGRF